MANETAAPFVDAPCFCKGRNQRCTHCSGTGTREYKSCRRCGGTGRDGSAKCVDCRGQGWRDLDNMDVM